MSNVLINFVGHPDLDWSMYRLFHERLGYQILTPSGFDGVVCSGDNPEHTHTPNHNYVTQTELDLYGCDLIVGTSWEAERPLFDLAARKGIPFIRHIANVGEGPVNARNVLLSTRTKMPAGVNWIQYHPEHRPCFVIDPSIPVKKLIATFIILKGNPVELALFNELERLLPEYKFEQRDVNGKVLHRSMQECAFIYHNKGLGCCGYTARQALTCGVPLIVNKVSCNTHLTLAKNYLVPGENCIDGSEATSIAAQIRAWNRTPQQVVDSFKSRVNFDLESDSIKGWLNNIS